MNNKFDKAVGFSFKRDDGYFRIFIENSEYEGKIDPSYFEHYENMIRMDNKNNLIKELEAINGGKLKLVKRHGESKNACIVRGLERLDKWD